MPKVRALTPEKRFEDKCRDLAMECEVLMLKNHVSKTQVAEMTGVSPQAIHNQFSRGNVTVETLIAVFSLAKPSAETIERLVSIK